MKSIYTPYIKVTDLGFPLIDCYLRGELAISIPLDLLPTQILAISCFLRPYHYINDNTSFKNSIDFFKKIKEQGKKEVILWCEQKDFKTDQKAATLDFVKRNVYINTIVPYNLILEETDIIPSMTKISEFITNEGKEIPCYKWLL